MTKYLTHYWKVSTCDTNKRQGKEGKPLTHTAGNLFVKRGVGRGDRIYVVSVRRGRMHFIGAMTVAKVLLRAEARRRWGKKVWPGRHHLLARRGTASPMRFDREVPLRTVRSLRFDTAKGLVGLKFISRSELDNQTLRELRHLTPESAAMLDHLIAEDES